MKITQFQMKEFMFLLSFLIIFVVSSCFSTPSKSNIPEAKVYFYQNPTTEYFEVESIGLSSNSYGVIYSLNRDETLVMMEIGKYSITDGVITINAGKFQAVGIMTDEKIIIDNKEYYLYKK